MIVDSSPQASPGGRDRRSLIPLARNALRKLRTLRHPDVLRFIDGCETDSTVYIVTEPVEPLTGRIGPEGEKPGSGDEWKVWGLCRLTVRRLSHNRKPIPECVPSLHSSLSTDPEQARTAILDRHRSLSRQVENGDSVVSMF